MAVGTAQEWPSAVQVKRVATPWPNKRARVSRRTATPVSRPRRDRSDAKSSPVVQKYVDPFQRMLKRTLDKSSGTRVDPPDLTKGSEIRLSRRVLEVGSPLGNGKYA